MKAEILKMLRETGDYVSGQEICEKFGVSRTAVWKVIRQLQEEGYQVEAVRSKGYRILDEPDVITAEEVASLMETEWAGKPVVYYPETDSTNIRIRHLGDEGAPHGTLAVADRQTGQEGPHMGMPGRFLYLYVHSSAPGAYSGKSAHAYACHGMQRSGRHHGLRRCEGSDQVA